VTPDPDPSTRYLVPGMFPTVLIRPYEDRDAEGVVANVRAVFDEYEFYWDAEGYCSDLYDVEGSFEAFWVVEHEDRVVGCVGYTSHDLVPGEPGTVDHDRVSATDAALFRMYVRPEARGHRLGERLTLTVMDEARARGRKALELWSDKKLVHAHAMYVRMGARIVGERICPGDPDESPEWGFYLPL
jgi:GNAT superfamily N-acetyltransferase